MEIMPDTQYELGIKEKIKSSKNLIEKYNNLCPDAKDEINYLNKIHGRNYMNYNLHHTKNTTNHQTINNISFNSSDDFDEIAFELYEKIFEQKRYKFFFKELLDKKPMNDINKSEINIQIEKGENIVVFMKKYNDNNKMYYGIYMRNSFLRKLKIYDINGKMINEISLLLFDFPCFLLYNDTTLIICELCKSEIIFFSENYVTQEIIKINFDYNLNDNIWLNLSLLIKTSLNKFFFFN